MWQNESFGGGGFDTNLQGSAGGGQSDKKTVRRPQSIVPLTVRQVLESPESGLKIAGIDVQLVTLVGIVKSVGVSSIKITYTLEDDTGAITGTFWLDGDQDSSNIPAAIPVVENTYCCMSGSIRNQGGKKHIMVFNIYTITDLNEVTAHMLAVINISLKAEQMTDQVAAEPTMKNEMSMSYGTNNFESSMSMNNCGLTVPQQRVYRAVKAMQGRNEGGANAHDVLTAMTVKMPLKEVEKILDFLVQEGHIYSTIDDYHFMVTDSHAFED